MADSNSQYSSVAGFIYIFNLIVGAGALAMPKAFSEAGLLISAVVVMVLAFLSFLTCTFMVESMAIANAFLQNRNLENDSENSRTDLKGSEATKLLGNDMTLNTDRSFELSTKVEMGEMAHMFFNKIGIRLFYLCIAIYLYGDLAIYATAVPKSLEEVVCGLDDNKVNTSDHGSNNSHSNDTSEKQCWGMETMAVYRIFVAIFAVLVCPFAFTNVQKTKYIQYLTTLFRWLSFTTMIILAFIRLGRHKANGNSPVLNFGGIPDLFGATVYSFMCQHSLPSLVTPIRNKKSVTKILALDIMVALLFYSLLSFSAVLTFKSSQIKDVYTLSFRDVTTQAVSTFLSLYPVFALSASFPIISITLRENLKALFRRDDREFSWAVDRIAFPLLAVVPPILVALCTENVELLVSLTGSYAGVGVQYIIPTMLLYCGRQKASDMFGEYENRYKSLFSHSYWVWAVMAWTALSVVVVTVYNILSRI